MDLSTPEDRHRIEKEMMRWLEYDNCFKEDMQCFISIFVAGAFISIKVTLVVPLRPGIKWEGRHCHWTRISWQRILQYPDLASLESLTTDTVVFRLLIYAVWIPASLIGNFWECHIPTADLSSCHIFPSEQLQPKPGHTRFCNIMVEQTEAPISIDIAEEPNPSTPVISVTERSGTNRGWHFWGIFLSLAVASLTSALDLSAISNALPVIVNDLHGSQFVWVGSAYTLSSTAFLPMSGGLAQAFGRRPVILFSLLIFGIGSAMCGAAPSMNFLIAARTLQGVGGGGILSLTSIIISDLVPLQERGLYQGLIGISWALATATGPLIGGALAQRGVWRWLFYLNLFTTTLAAICMLVLLRLKNPAGTIREKLARMDWIGNVMVIAASSSLLIALTWGGVQYPWSSPRVLTPLVLGVAGFGAFVFYEAKYAKNPLVPISLMSNRTTVSGYIQTFIMSIIMLAISYYLPVFYQACQGASPIATGVDAFGMAFTVAPVGIIVGASVAVSKQYRPQLWMGWCFLLIGTGLLTLLEVESGRGISIGFQAVSGVGLGLLLTTTFFPVLAPLPVSANAHAVAFLIFMRTFGQVWGVAVGATVLQNQLVKRLPEEFTAAFPQGVEIAYASVAVLDSLPQPLQGEVRVAFANSLRVIWQVMIGMAGVGLGVSLTMKHVELRSTTDQEWDLDEKKAGADEDRAAEPLPVAVA